MGLLNITVNCDPLTAVWQNGIVYHRLEISQTRRKYLEFVSRVKLSPTLVDLSPYKSGEQTTEAAV